MDVKEGLKKTGLWDVDPLNLFRITWKNEPKQSGGLYGGLDGIRAGFGAHLDVRAGLPVNGLDGGLQRGRIGAGHGNVRAVDQNVPLVIRALAVHVDRHHGVGVSLQRKSVADGLRVSSLAAVAQCRIDRYCDHIGILHKDFHFFIQIRCHISLPPA